MNYQNNSCSRLLDKRKQPVWLEMKTPPALLACAVALVLAGCGSLAPADHSAHVDVGAAWKTQAAPEGWIDADARRAWQAGQWWTLFGDATLDALMPRVELDNANLAAAVAAVQQAQALLRQTEAGYAPTLGANVSTSRSGRPAQGSASLRLNGSWAPDLWGELADSVRAQGANVQASQANLAAARLSAQSSLAQAYFTLREADAERQLLDDIITGYERAATINRNRYQAGIAAHTDLQQAESTLANARASRAALQASRDTAEHAMALLLGVPPSAFNLSAAPWVTAVPAIPAALPSDLLLRRPDIASAERAVAAANARIGVARAAYFPSLNLSAGLGGNGADLAKLVSAPTLAWSLGLALAQTLFDGGARDAAVEQARAAHLAASAGYRQKVLGALGEVEDQLTSLGSLVERLQQTRLAADAARGAETRIMNRYQAGLAAYTEVVTAQASSLSAQRAVMQLQLQRQQGAIGLIQALGGGWVAPWLAPDAVPSANADASAAPPEK